MANNFDWQTEDNFDWDQLTAEDSTLPPSKKSRRWLYLVVILLLLGGTVFMIWRQVEQRVDTNLEAMQADIISSHNLIKFAAAEQDIELFVSLLSGRDSNWTQAQNGLFNNDLLLDRAPFGLHALGTDNQPFVDDQDNVAVEFSPDLVEAELLNMQPYTVAVGNGVTETVVLQQSFTYRQGRERWLLSPPKSDFWGEPQTLSSPHFTLTYPARDAEVGERLMEDLERKVNEACRLLSVGLCPDNYVISLDLSDDPVTLADTNGIVPITSNGRTLNLTLPAPSLVGIPVDEAGYQALFRGYGVQLVTAVTAHLLDYSCCEHAPLYRAILDYQLSQLSLKPWPVDGQTYQRVLDQQIQFEDIVINGRDFSWADATWENVWPTYTLLDFLQHNDPNLTIAQMHNALGQSSTLYQWLELLQADPFPDRSALVEKTDRQFWQYAYEKGLQLSDTTPDSLPQQALYLLCTTNEDALQTTLYRYQPQQDSWTPAYTAEGFFHFTSLPSEDALILHSTQNARGQLQTLLWKDNQTMSILVDQELITISNGQTDPKGQLLTGYTFRAGDQTANIFAFDLEQCDENGCTSKSLPSIPVWSPNGGQALFTEDPNSQLGFLSLDKRIILVDPTGNETNLGLFYAERNALFGEQPVTEVMALENIGQGFAPFWIDEQTYGYFQNVNGRSQTNLLIATTEDNSPTTMLQTGDLQAALPDEHVLQSLVMRYALPHPTNPQILYVAALQNDTRSAHVFAFNRQSEELSWLMQVPVQVRGGQYQHELSVTGNGRYLTLGGLTSNRIEPLNPIKTLQIYDTEHKKSIPFMTIPFTSFHVTLNSVAPYDWSQDGQWLAVMLENNQLALFAPEQNYLRTIPLDYGSCTSPVWINQTTN